MIEKLIDSKCLVVHQVLYFFMNSFFAYVFQNQKKVIKKLRLTAIQTKKYVHNILDSVCQCACRIIRMCDSGILISLSIITYSKLVLNRLGISIRSVSM